MVWGMERMVGTGIQLTAQAGMRMLAQVALTFDAEPTTDRSSQVETNGFSLSRCSLRNLASFGEITIRQYG